MIKRLTPFYFLLAVLLLFSCTDEETLDTDLGTADLAADLSNYANSPFGMYKGVFTTNDSQERGVITIQAINDDVAKASLTTLDGTEILFKGRLASNFNISDVSSFEFRSFTGTDQFIFDVNMDGSNPQVRGAFHNGIASTITVVKELQRGAVTMNTGTYTDGGSLSGTFSLVFNTGDGTGSDTDITTQVMTGLGTLMESMSNAQTGCATNATNTLVDTCAISGTLTGSGSLAISWSGAHGYFNDPTVCSALGGIWSGTGAAGGAIGGTFVSDGGCDFGCLSATSATAGTTGDIFSNATLDATATVIDTGNLGVDTLLDNVTLDITHTFDGDLVINLISPAGTNLNLTDGNGGSGDNFTGTVFRDGGAVIAGTDNTSPPYTGDFQPEGGTFAATYANESITGDWTLSIEDTATGDEGTLNSWSVAFCDGIGTSVMSPPPPPVNAARAVEVVEPVLSKKEYKRSFGSKEAYQLNGKN